MSTTSLVTLPSTQYALQASRQTLDIKESSGEESLSVLYNNGSSSLSMTVNRSYSYREVTYTAEGVMATGSLSTASTDTTQDMIDRVEQMLEENATDNRPEIISAEIKRILSEVYGEGNPKRNSPKYLIEQDSNVATYGVMVSYREMVVDETVEINALVPSGDFYSPENTAQRIVDFALSFFSGGDRAEYAEMVRDAVMKGYEEAQAAIGWLPQESTDTINLVMDAIDQFAANSTVDTVM